MQHFIGKRFWLLALILSVASLSLNAAQAAEKSLLDSVTQELGISPEQASGALGSVFKMAQSSMGKMDFKELANVVPGISDMISSAPAVKQSSASKMLGGFGGMAKSAGNLEMLTASLEKLGISSEMAAPLVGQVYEYVQSEGGQALLEKLKSSLKLPF